MRSYAASMIVWGLGIGMGIGQGAGCKKFREPNEYANVNNKRIEEELERWGVEERRQALALIAKLKDENCELLGKVEREFVTRSPEIFATLPGYHKQVDASLLEFSKQWKYDSALDLLSPNAEDRHELMMIFAIKYSTVYRSTAIYSDNPDNYINMIKKAAKTRSLDEFSPKELFDLDLEKEVLLRIFGAKK